MPIAWYPSRWQDWCVPQDEKQETEKLLLIIWYAEIKNVLIIEDDKIWSKRVYNFYGQRQITDIFTINVNKYNKKQTPNMSIFQF